MPSPACPICHDLQVAATTVAAAFPALMETIHTGDWKISSCAATNGYPCTSAPVSRISSGNPGQAGVDHMTNEMTMTNAVIECILSRSAAKYYDTAATLSDAKIRELVRIGRFQRRARASGVGGGSGHHAGKYGVGLGNPRARPVHGAPAAPARRGSTYLWRRR